MAVLKKKESPYCEEDTNGEAEPEMAASTFSSRPPPHMVLFPFMSKGHTIPLLDLARLLLHRNTTVTFFTTPANRPFIADSLSGTDASIVELPFPENIAGVPAGVESTDKLPSMSLFFPFTSATKLMQPDFEKALEALPCITAVVSDGLLWWTQESATKFGIPRILSYGMNSYSWAVFYAVMKDGLLSGPEHDDEPIVVTDFPWITVTRNDFDEPFNSREPKGPHVDLLTEMSIANSRSYGIVANSFYELEAFYVEYCNRRESEPKIWCVGPLCLAEHKGPTMALSCQKPTWLQWLDKQLAQGNSVLYVAFGTQAEISSQQLHEIAIGLEESNVNFFWVTRKMGPGIDDGFEERVKERGLVVREWVDQRSILRHESVHGFLSHCGWNSVSESICAEVPILAWPMMAEQHSNARLVVEEIKVGLRVQTSDGSAKGFVTSEGLKKMVRELMVGEMGKEVREKVKEFGVAAKKGMEEGGSSWHSLNQLIGELQALSR